MERPDVVSDNALNDRPAEQQAVIAGQGSGRIAQMIFGFLGDCGRRQSTKFDDLRPIDLSGRKRIAGIVELSNGVDAEDWCALAPHGRGVCTWARRRLIAVLGEDRDLCERCGSLTGHFPIPHQLRLKSAERSKRTANVAARSESEVISADRLNLRARGFPSDRCAAAR